MAENLVGETGFEPATSCSQSKLESLISAGFSVEQPQNGTNRNKSLVGACLTKFMAQANRRVGKIALAAALLVVPFSAAADPAKDTPDWIHFGTTPTKTEVYARRADIMAGRSHHTDARFWLRLDFSRDRTVAIRETKTLYTVNCPRRTYRSLSIVAYRPDGSNLSWEPEGKTEHVVPDTFMESIVDVLCFTPEAGNDLAVPGGEL